MADRGHGPIRQPELLPALRLAQDPPVGTAYAIQTGTGTQETAVLGILLLSEPGDLFRMLSILLMVTGVVGLRLTS